MAAMAKLLTSYPIRILRNTLYSGYTAAITRQARFYRRPAPILFVNLICVSLKSISILPYYEYRKKGKGCEPFPAIFDPVFTTILLTATKKTKLRAADLPP